MKRLPTLNKKSINESYDSLEGSYDHIGDFVEKPIDDLINVASKFIESSNACSQIESEFRDAMKFLKKSESIGSLGNVGIIIELGKQNDLLNNDDKETWAESDIAVAVLDLANRLTSKAQINFEFSIKQDKYKAIYLYILMV